MPARLQLSAFSIMLGWAALVHPGLYLLARSDWIEVTSPHFRLVSNAGSKATRDAAIQFEQIRQAFRQALPETRTDPGQPIVVLAVKDSASLRELLPQYGEGSGSLQPAGVFLPGPERHYVALRLDVQGEIPYHALYHEYFHLILQINHPRVPLWLSEGLAEFYAHSHISKDGIAVGLPGEAHIRRLRTQELLPVKTLFRVDQKSAYYNESKKASIFYSQAWALTHYLMTAGRQGTRNPIDKLLVFLSQGVNRDQAVEMALGPFHKLEEKLAGYITQNEFHFYTYPPALDGHVRLLESALTSAEAAAIRAAFLVRNDRPAEAQELIYKALNTNPNEALAFESLGYLHYRARRFQDAFEAFENAVGLQTTSYLSHYLYAILALSEKHNTDPAWKRIEPSLREAIRLRPTFPHSYSSLARHFLGRGENFKEALELALEASRLEPRNLRHLEILGHSLLSLGRYDQVGEVVQRIRRIAETREDLRISESLTRKITEKETRITAGKTSTWSYDYSLQEGSGEDVTIPGNLIHELRGKFSSVICQAAYLEMTVETEGQVVKVISWDYPAIEYILPLGKDPFDPCLHLEGAYGMVRLFDDRKEGAQRLLGVLVVTP